MYKSSIPNILTFINLSIGIISIIFCFNDKIVFASISILFAALIDRYDGMIARKLNVVSSLGKELDSLSDMVSFGIAPVLMIWKISLFNLGIIGYIILLVYPICGAFRLARFNVVEFKNVYTGIPITIAGAVVALDAIAAVRLGVHGWITIILMLALSYLMVSSIKIKKI